ncbi:unnamed protein product, partial [marine sediment metagenome]
PRMTGTVVYEVSPLEKIQKTFQEDAKTQILNEVESLDGEQKKILKFVETIQKGTNITEIMEKCLFLKPSGGSRSRVTKKIATINMMELIRKDRGGHIFPNLKQRISKLMEIHNATTEEIESVYNHVLMA